MHSRWIRLQIESFSILKFCEYGSVISPVQLKNYAYRYIPNHANSVALALACTPGEALGPGLSLKGAQRVIKH